MSVSADIPDLRKGIYKHTKSGLLYQVLGVAVDTETTQALVVYKPLYSHELGYELFVRPYDMFVESVELDGSVVPRFEFIKD